MSDAHLQEIYGFRDVRVDGVSLASIDEATVARIVADSAARGQGGWVITPNVDMLYLRRHDPQFDAMLGEASLLVADGAPLVTASRIAGTPLPGRVCGSDLLKSVSAAAAERGLRVFLLGGNPGTAEKAASILSRRFPGFSLAGTYSPPFGFESEVDGLESIRCAIDRSAPGVVFVALGTPKQEIVIRELRTSLPNVWWLGIGAGFSMLTGDVTRAPSWVGRLGMEWVWRLAQEPGRLFTRYVLHDAPVAIGLFAAAFRERFRHRP
jgi:N-acetylglucosaminyldiphosphoundecaprenol N-acetyl-beta-D-mannosaminyltransferase